jgi:hypothetical protein
MSDLRSLLPIVLAADNFPAFPAATPYPTSHPHTNEPYIPFHLTFLDYQNNLPPVGLLRPHILAELQADPTEEGECPWQFYYEAQSRNPDQTNDKDGSEQDAEMELGSDLELEVRCVFFADWVVKGGKDMITRAMQKTVEKWRHEGKFQEALGGMLHSILPTRLCCIPS